MYFNLTGRVIFHNQLFKKDYLKDMEVGVLRAVSELEAGRTVALAMNRTPLMLATLFVLLRRGIPFLPIDITFPTERLEYMLEKAEIETIISDCKKNICGRETLFLTCPEDLYTYNGNAALKDETTDTISDDEVAYILFTSGTTGLPKAVEVLRRGLKNFIDGIMERVSFSKNCRMVCLTNMTFDIFFLESVLALNTGMTVVLADENERNNPRLIKNLIENNKVNAMQCTPSTMRMLEMIDPKYEFLREMKTVMIGGEPFPPTLLATLQKVMMGRIYNMYGPTETTIWSTVSDLTEAKEVTIGKPIKDTEIIVADEDLKPVPVGCEGEILIAGAGLAKGYLHDEERTAEAFVSLSSASGEVRVYRTGDFGYVSPSGEYVCTGRRDGQVKVLGHRIELGDVEHHIGRIPGMGNNVVVTDPEDENRLICFYLSEEDLAENELRQEALKRLPEYMVPSSWVPVVELLYTASGKTDRRAMLKKYRHATVVCGEMKQETGEKDWEGSTADYDDIVRQVIDCFDIVEEEMTEDTVLESLGLDSLKYVSCLVKLEDLFNMEFEAEMLAASYFVTIKDLTECIRESVKNHK